MKLRQKFLLVACVVLFVLPLVQACIVVDTGVFSPAQSLEWIGLVFLSVLSLVALEREKVSETIRDLVEVSALSAMFAGLEIVVCCQPSGMGREGCYFLVSNGWHTGVRVRDEIQENGGCVCRESVACVFYSLCSIHVHRP